ncbi:MAG: DUF4193 family protein [Actinomycetota bacterium]
MAEEEVVEPDLESEEDDDDDDVTEEGVGSIEEISEGDEEDDDEPVVDDSRTEQLIERAVPQQANEFVCQSCFLVKHRSQMADPKKKYCQDCA